MQRARILAAAAVDYYADESRGNVRREKKTREAESEAGGINTPSHHKERSVPFIQCHLKSGHSRLRHARIFGTAGALCNKSPINLFIFFYFFLFFFTPASLARNRRAGIQSVMTSLTGGIIVCPYSFASYLLFTTLGPEPIYSALVRALFGSA